MDRDLDRFFRRLRLLLPPPPSSPELDLERFLFFRLDVGGDRDLDRLLLELLRDFLDFFLLLLIDLRLDRPLTSSEASLSSSESDLRLCPPPPTREGVRLDEEDGVSGVIEAAVAAADMTVGVALARTNFLR